MTDPSQYFRGRTVQEQMNEVIGYVDVRSAEVATDAIASDVAQVHQDMLDADADATAAAASAAAAAGTLANAVKKTGEASQSIAGDIVVAGDLSGGTVTVPTPVNNTDAASKQYVDTLDANNVKLTGTNKIGDYAVLLTGNQTKSGILKLSTANGLLLDTTSGYNLLTIKAKGSATGVDLNDTTNDANNVAADRRVASLRHFYAGGTYDTHWIEFKPRNAIVDSGTTNASGGIEFVVSNDNEVTVNLFAYNSGGTVVRKQLAKFTNGAWN